MEGYTIVAYLGFPVLLGLGLLLMLRWVRLWGQRGQGAFIGSLKDKHVFITGGSSGIGFSIAYHALRQGAFVTIVSRSSTNLTKATEKLLEQVQCSPGNIRSQVADVSVYSAITKAIREASTWKAIDVLICNAGLTRGGYIDEVSIGELDLTINTNLMGTIYTVHAALPLMKQQSRFNPSSVVIMGSFSSLFLMYGHSVYTATKYAVRGLAEGLRLELLPFNIKVSLICPYFVKTAFLDEVQKDQKLCDIMKSVNFYDQRYAHSADHVARVTLKAMKEGQFLVTTEDLGFYLAVLGRGFMPADSLSRSLLEVVLFLPLRFITTKFFHDACNDIIRTNSYPSPIKLSYFQSFLSNSLFGRGKSC